MALPAMAAAAVAVEEEEMVEVLATAFPIPWILKLFVSPFPHYDYVSFFASVSQL